MKTFEQARREYPHRYTLEHVPQWAKQPCANGKYYAPQYRTDREWYENTKFKGDVGWFGIDDDCSSTNATWPLGKWLDRPYKG